MKTITAGEITQTVKRLFLQANTQLPADLRERIEACTACERSAAGKSCFEDMKENFTIAAAEDLPICQDTGMAVVFAEVGQALCIEGNFEDAVNEGVRQAYQEGAFRCSVVADPILRGNTNDNTPAILHTRLVPGDALRLTPKGFGSENMSRIRMFTPAASEEDIVEFVAQCVREAGSNPCPPVVVGVGIGGDFEYCALLAKKALCRPVDVRNGAAYYAALEKKMLRRINALGVGPQGFGGDVTALAVNIEQFATHIAGLPVAVNMGCHVTRHASAVL